MTILCLHMMFAAIFEVQEFPLPASPIEIFLAPGDEAGTLELFVLEQDQLRVYFDGDPGTSREIQLPDGATALDVFDLNNDGVWELFVVAGEAIHSYPLGRQAAEPEGEIIFRQASTLSGGLGRPFLHVLGIEWKGQRVIGLPTEDSFNLYRRSGEVAASFPIGLDAPHRAALRPFNSWVITPPQVAPPDGIELRISSILEVAPQLPEELLPLGETGPLYRTQGSQRAANALQLPVERWPWFPLDVQEDSVARVFYAFDGAGRHDTIVRIRQRDAATETVRISPPRRYPGQLLDAAAVTPPDFNGDGFTDLALWQTPEPSPTLGTLTRTALRGSWPLRITAHLYDPARARFAAETDGAVRLQLPLAHFLKAQGRVPVDHLILDDFDGDGKTDLALAPEPDRFVVWRFEEEGFVNQATDNHAFPAPVEEVVFSGRMGETGGYGIGLRAHDSLFLLRTAER